MTLLVVVYRAVCLASPRSETLWSGTASEPCCCRVKDSQQRYTGLEGVKR